MTSQICKKSLLVALFAMSSVAIHAQDDKLLADADAVLNSEQITIDGTFAKKVEEKTPEEILDEARRANEIRQIKKIAKRIEKIALPERQVRKITKKESNRLASRINTIFNDGEDEPQVQDKVAVKQAAPVAPQVITPIVITKTEPKKEVKPLSNVKIMPYAGYQNVWSEDIDFTAKVNGGLNIESMINNRVSAGIGFNYSTLDVTDDATDHDLNYKHFTVEANAKFFFTYGTAIRPYVGVGLSYNRANLNYTNLDTTYTTSYDEAEHTASYLGGHLRAGSELHFSKNVGMFVEFSYSHGLTGGNDVVDGDTYAQRQIEVVGESMEDADFISVNAGLVVTF